MNESNHSEGGNETDSLPEAVGTVTALAAESKPESESGTEEAKKQTESDAESETEPEAKPETEPEAEPETEPKPARKKNKLLPAIIIPAAAVALFAGGLALRAVIPFHAELGSPVDYRFPRFLIDADTTSVDSGKLGEYALPAKILGFINTSVKMKVSDTTPPKVTLRQPVIMTGQLNVQPEDFVESCEDMQEVKYYFDDAPDFLTQSGSCTFKLIAEDESGNTSKLDAYCDLDESIAGITFELGTPEAEISKELSKTLGVKPEDIDGLSDAFGEHPLRVNGDRLTLLTIEVVDTIPPKAEPNNLDLFLGERLLGEQIWQFVKNVEDESEVTVSYSKSEPNWDKTGVQSVGLNITDAAGNSIELHSMLRLHDIPSSITVEAGTTTSELLDKLLSNCKDNKPEPDGSYELSNKPVGTHELVLKGQFSGLGVSVTVIDTVAPVITLHDLTTDRGVLPSPSEFVETCRDATSVSYEYDSEPDVSETGDIYVTIVATDEGGNKTRESAWLSIIVDITPPVLYGVKNIYSYEGDSISYRAGVSAIDAADGRVTVYVDSSQVKTSTAGTYPITYRATDSSGNTVTQSAYVYVRKVTQATLDEYADSILGQILTDGMTEREKAKAIYDWCRETLKYSTVTSYLMGNYYKAAYSGYRLHYGNCYTYYAVARSLLTRAGITNQMIQRDNPSKPHYWNLVKIDGYWYHFDTCPQPYPNNIGCFLLTDAEVADYSTNRQSGYYSFTKGIYPATP